MGACKEEEGGEGWMSNLLSVKYKQDVKIPFRVRAQASTAADSVVILA